MPFITWNDRLSVEVEALDNDHKQLVEMLNELFDSIRDGAPRATMSRRLDELVEYTQQHFAREESLFAIGSYPDAEEHMHEHSNMTAWLREMRARFERGTVAGPSLEAVNFLKDWLFDHILGSDRKYVAYMKGLGIR